MNRVVLSSLLSSRGRVRTLCLELNSDIVELKWTFLFNGTRVVNYADVSFEMSIS